MPSPRPFTKSLGRGDCRSKRVKFPFFKEGIGYSSIWVMAVLHKDVSDICTLGSWDWIVFDVLSSKSNSQRSPSRLIAGGSHHIIIFFLMLVGLPAVSLAASLLFALLVATLISCCTLGVWFQLIRSPLVKSMGV